MQTIIEFLAQPWPWWVAGPLIACIMAALWWTGQSFGVSGTLRTLCSMGGAGRLADFFKYDWRADRWNLFFILGAMIGGAVAGYLIPFPEAISLAPDTLTTLQDLRVSTDTRQLAPANLFDLKFLATLPGLLMLIGGGLCIGFGTRYAGGCTSGHAITGLSHLQWPSLIAVIGFFTGGLISAHWLLPFLLNL